MLCFMYFLMIFPVYYLSGNRFKVSVVACDNPAFEFDDKDPAINQSTDRKLSFSEFFSNFGPRKSLAKLGDGGKICRYKSNTIYHTYQKNCNIKADCFR